MRHPELHQNPEILRSPETKEAAAQIEIGQHVDGRWMWAVSWRYGISGGGYACGVKWGNFAATRQAALDAAIAEGLERVGKANTPCEAVRAWLNSLCPRQADLFMTPGG